MEKTELPKKGIYRHFKGNEYELLGFARHSENGETMVKQIEEWIEADSRDAYDKEVGRLKGQLYYGFFCLPPQKAKRVL